MGAQCIRPWLDRTLSWCPTTCSTKLQISTWVTDEGWRGRPAQKLVCPQPCKCPKENKVWGKDEGEMLAAVWASERIRFHNDVHWHGRETRDAADAMEWVGLLDASFAADWAVPDSKFGPLYYCFRATQSIDRFEHRYGLNPLYHTPLSSLRILEKENAAERDIYVRDYILIPNINNLSLYLLEQK